MSLRFLNPVDKARSIREQLSRIGSRFTVGSAPVIPALPIRTHVVQFVGTLRDGKVIKNVRKADFGPACSMHPSYINGVEFSILVDIPAPQQIWTFYNELSSAAPHFPFFSRCHEADFRHVPDDRNVPL